MVAIYMPVVECGYVPFFADVLSICSTPSSDIKPWGTAYDEMLMLILGEAYSVTWNLGTNRAFAVGLRKTTENLDRVGRSQDLPDVY
jgi:hypothetical protein